jgi:hypothetical protein
MLVSTVDDTTVVVVRWTAGDATLTCGGAPMVEKSQRGTPTRATIDDAHAAGTLLGKRYVAAGDTVEVLCVKPGSGSLALDETPLTVKSAKPLPASD